MPTVSVIIPVYNQERFIAESVQSALSQTFKDLEVVVVDDGSTDKTPYILESFGNQIKSIRLKKNKGAPVALNTGIRNASGTYLSWLSGDDLLLPEKLETQIRFFRDNPQMQFVGSDFYFIDADGNVLSECQLPRYQSKQELFYNLLCKNFFDSEGLFERKCIEKTGYFDESMPYLADYDMSFRMAKHFTFGHIRKPLYKYRWYPENFSHHYWNTLRCFYRLYRKVFETYDIREFFPEGFPLDEAYLEAAQLMLDRKIYSVALTNIVRRLGVKALDKKAMDILFPCLLNLPKQMLIQFISSSVPLRQERWLEQKYYGMRKFLRLRKQAAR